MADLELAMRLADLADGITMRWWDPAGLASTAKEDGSPVTEADIAVETALRDAVLEVHPNDGFAGEEIGERPGTSGRRWIVDPIDGTRFFAAGERTWGTLIALEVDRVLVLGLATSPALRRRWWAERGGGAFTTSEGGSPRRIHVSAAGTAVAVRLATLPAARLLEDDQLRALERLAGDLPPDRTWSHQLAVAEGELDACIWWGGDLWDHAAPSVIVEEAGGRTGDHDGGPRLDGRRVVMSNGLLHEQVLAALRG
jgi:histidinol-phosphatase